ncbi:MAG: hypothetical protein Q9207_004375 [Kuettlingeria erythrocarpa]
MSSLAELGPAELSKLALSKVQPGKPKTYGGAIKNPALLEKVFISHTVPDVQPDTRILAVCGITDCEDDADPSNDGWFLSDFYAFNFLLRNEGAAQSWMTTENPSQLIEKYHEYLHGSQLQTRKAVLDNDILTENPPHHLKLFPRDALLANFLSAVKAECDVARELDQPVLVLLFGHGDQTSKGVYLGVDPSGPKPTYPLLEMEAFREAMGVGVAVTVVSTACFSGGWAVNPRLNATTLAGAAPGLSKVDPKYITGVSESWTASESLSRSCGSIYATAIIKALTSEDVPFLEERATAESSKEADDRASENDRASTYGRFCENLYRILFTQVDNWAAVHDIRFSAQDDEWGMEWKRRTGLPLSHYAAKWETLREVLPDPSVTTSASRDPTKLAVQTDESDVRRGAFGSREHSSTESNTLVPFPSLRSLVLHQAMMYMASFPGWDTLAPNVSLHNGITILRKGKPLSLSRLQRIHEIVDFRMELMKAADHYVDALGIPRPGGKRCSEWDIAAWVTSEENRQLCRRGTSEQPILEALQRSGLFPGPSVQKGHAFTKPMSYLSSALHLADVDAATLEAVIETLVAIKDKAVSIKRPIEKIILLTKKITAESRDKRDGYQWVKECDAYDVSRVPEGCWREGQETL